MTYKKIIPKSKFVKRDIVILEGTLNYWQPITIAPFLLREFCMNRE